GGERGELEADRSDRTGLSGDLMVSPGHVATAKVRPDECRLDANGLRGEGDCVRLVDGDGVEAVATDADKGDDEPSRENSGADGQQQGRVDASSGVPVVSPPQGGEALGAAAAPETPRNERQGQQPPRQHQHHQQKQQQ
ncbi:unnamed protein product, partial [Laminaria digitata]